MLTPRNSPQNGVVERRNRSIMDYARTLIMEENLSQKYWRQVVSIAIYTFNRVQVNKGKNATSFE